MFAVLTPLDKEFSRKARLEVRLAAQHHFRVGNPSQVGQTVAEGQMTELERVIPLVLETPHQLVAHPLHLRYNCASTPVVALNLTSKKTEGETDTWDFENSTTL